MSNQKIVVNHRGVEDFVLEEVGIFRNEGLKSIGLIDDSGIVAGVIYESFNGHNCFMHVAAKPGKHWMRRRTLHEFFRYPFETCGVKRVSGWVEASNEKAFHLDRHLGFRVEATLKGAASDGGDVLLMTMWKDECRFLGEKYGKEISAGT